MTFIFTLKRTKFKKFAQGRKGYQVGKKKVKKVNFENMYTQCPLLAIKNIALKFHLGPDTT